MSDEQLEYVNAHWGGLPAFLEAYIAVDRQLRHHMNPQGGDAVVESIKSVTSGLIKNAQDAITSKLTELQSRVSDKMLGDSQFLTDLRTMLPGGAHFDEALGDQLSGNNMAARERFLGDLITKLKTADNGTLLAKFESMLPALESNRFEVKELQSDLDKMKAALQNNGNVIDGPSTPLNEVNGQVMFHRTTGSSDIGREVKDKMKHMLDKTFKKAKVEAVGAAGDRADFQLTKTGKPDVLLELKDSKDKVATQDVNKMEDEVQLNCRHAIMISLRSGVVERGDFDFRVIDNRYVALYLTNVDWDMTKVKAAVNLIYSLDEVFRAGHAEGNVVFTPEVVDAISDQVKAFQGQIKAALRLMEKSKNTLLGLHFDQLTLQLATGVRVAQQAVMNQAPEEQQRPVRLIECGFCGKTDHDKSNMNKHQRNTCKANPDSKRYDPNFSLNKRENSPVTI